MTPDDQNPLIRGDHSSIAVKDLHNNVDNHTDSHDIITNSTNHNTVDNSSTVIYNGAAASEKLLSQRREEYRAFCRKNIISGVISRNTRLELNEKASALSLDSTVASEIEQSVLSSLEAGCLSSTDRITLDIAIEALSNNSGRDILEKLVALADRSEDEEVQFYSNLALAVYEPRRCVTRYVNKSFDSYWQSFWTYMAYKKIGNSVKAENILISLSAWTDQPSGQATLLSGAGCLYDYFAANGSEMLKNTALGYLNRVGDLSPMLNGFVETLVYLCRSDRPVFFTSDPGLDFYLTLFGAKQKPKATLIAEPKSFSAAPKSFAPANPLNITDPKVYEIADKVDTSPTTPITPITPITPDSLISATKPKSGKWMTISVIAVLVAAIYVVFRPSGDDSTPITSTPDITATGPSEVKEEILPTAADSRKQTTAKQTAPTSTRQERQSAAELQGSNNIAKTTETVAAEQTRQSASPAQSNSRSDESARQQPSQPQVQPQSTTAKRENPVQTLTAAAESGDASAAYRLGKMYLDGDGVAKSNKTAFALFSKSAAAGNANGMYMTGWCYRMGRGTKKDLKLAKQWWDKAASLGHAQAAEDVKELQSLM